MPGPPEPPDSIVLGQFAGLRNTVARERLAPGELVQAKNIDIDDSGQIRRRRGYRRVNGLPHHSLAQFGSKTFGVRLGRLGRILPDGSFTDIAEALGGSLAYTAVGDTVYYSSPQSSGKIVDDARQDWGSTEGGGRWVSPVILPTDTLGPVAGQLLGAPPLASVLEYYRGRIYLAAGKYLWYTELYLYDHVDKTRNVIQFEHAITMLAAVEDGIFVGTTRELFFLRGTAVSGLARSSVIPAGVARGSMVQVPTADAHPEARSRAMPEGMSPMFLTTAGICLGTDGGVVHNLTRGRVEFPSAASAAALYRPDQGASAYVAVTDSAGGNTSNARIGDYVDAEIVRASQRG